jgi:very-short-patch-repair endonuclease
MRVGMAIVSEPMTNAEILRRHGTEYRGRFTLEDVLEEALVGAGLAGYRRQGPVELKGRRCRMDFQFADAQLDVEVDDSSHATPSIAAKDRERDAELAAIGWRVLRLSARDIVHDMPKCLHRIENML